MNAYRFLIKIMAGMVVFVMLFALVPQASVEAVPAVLPQNLPVQRVYDSVDGRLALLTPASGQTLRLPQAARMQPGQRAQAYLNAYGQAFGVSNPAAELEIERVQALSGGRTLVRYQQVYRGVPVLGGNLLVKTDTSGGLASISGRFQDGLDMAVNPLVDDQKAAQTARFTTAKELNVQADSLSLSDPALWIYDERTFVAGSQNAPRLVWMVSASTGQSSRVVLVDALHGGVVVQYSQAGGGAEEPVQNLSRVPAETPSGAELLAAPGAPVWEVYACESYSPVPSHNIFVCDSSNPTACDTPPAGVGTDAANARDYVQDAYEFYYTRFNRDGWDGTGGMWTANVLCGYLRSSPSWYAYSSWDRPAQEAVFGSTMTVDDIVGREFAAGMVLKDTGLINLFQSGAITESMADMWGEFIDQTNGAGNDVATVKWLIGEDVYPGTTTYLRSMKYPTLKLQPDKYSSIYYYRDVLENGRPTINSGLNNKAVSLMVDGGSFNRFSVGKIELSKVAAIYYRTQTEYLFPAADYLDLYTSLKSSCTDLTGTTPVGATTPISATDCLNLDKALKAVQMNLKYALVSGAAAPLCPTGYERGQSIFADNFNAGTLDQWTFEAYGYDIDGGNKTQINDQVSWQLLDGALTDNGKALYAPGMEKLDECVGTICTLKSAEEWARFSNQVTLPKGKQIYLTFDHMHQFETTLVTLSPYDGAVIEYSTDGGTTWVDARPLFSAGTNYNGTISTAIRQPFTYNVMMGRPGFVKNSLADRVSTRYNLTSLALLSDRDILVRWHIGYDYLTWWGWAIDNISLHTCIQVPALPVLKLPATGALVYDNPDGVFQPLLDWTDAIPDLDHYRVQVAPDSTFNPVTILYDQNVPTSQFQIPASLDPNTRYYWRVSALNLNNGTKGWSKAFSFRTSMLKPENLSLTGDGETRRPDFDWDDPNTILPAATNYTIQVSRNTTFTSLAGTYTTPNNVTQYTPVALLPADMTLYWRVRANGANPSAYSPYETFSTANPPTIPVLVSPTSNLLIQPNPADWENKPRLDWGIVTFPLGETFGRYEVQVDDNADFSSPAVNLVGVDGITDINQHEYTLLTGLDPNKTYHWRVQSVNGAGEYSNWATRYFRTAMLPPATLNKPDDGQPAHTKRPTYEWGAVDGATGYTIQVSANNTFTLIRATYTISTPVTTYTPIADLLPNTLYYWRIRANGPNGPSLYSGGHSFTTGNPPSVPALLSPANNALMLDYTPVLDWGPASIPVGTTFARYEVQWWSDNVNFTDLVSRDIAGDILNHVYPVDLDLNPNSKYYWRVRAWNTDGDWSAWSTVRYFRTAILPPTGLVPNGGSMVAGLRPVLDWDDMAGATSYNVQISLSPTLSSPFINVTAAGSTFTVPSGKLQYNKTYYWRVRAYGANGPSGWGAIESFTTPLAP